MFTKSELKALNKLAMKIIGIPFAHLDRYEQDFIYCEAEDRGML